MAEGIREVEVSAVVSASLAANLPANNKTVATIQLDPAIPALSMVTVPMDEAWVLEDFFVSTAPTPDCIVEFFRNLTESAFRSPPLSICLGTNPARPVPSPVMFSNGTIITVAVQNLAAVGTAAVTITVYAKLRKFTPH